MEVDTIGKRQEEKSQQCIIVFSTQMSIKSLIVLE